MHVLMCAAQAPLPPWNGLRLPLARLVAGLSERHRVQVIAMLAPDQEVPELADADVHLVRPPSPAMARAFAAGAAIRRRPLRADAHARALRNALRATLRDDAPDVVHVFSGRMAALAGQLDGHAAVLTALDAWHRNVAARVVSEPRWRRPLLRMEEYNVRRFSAEEYRRYSSVVVVSPQDAAALTELSADIPVQVIANGVDADAFAAPPDTTRDEDLLVFHGVMSYAPNVAAARLLIEEVLPRVRVHRPDAHAALVGRAPSPAVQQLGKNRGVAVTGAVKDVRPWLHRAAVYVCPMHTGTGIKNKVLEAMASGLAVVGTPLAMQGLDVVDGTHVLVAPDAPGVADATRRVLDDPEMGRRLGAAAAAHVREHHSWDAVVRAYERVYDDARRTVRR